MSTIIGFATVNTEFFPIVVVDFNGNIETDDEFEIFLNLWRKLYENQRDFTFIFNTENMSIPKPKYCYQMASFIKELHDMPYQYLQKSIMIVKNDIILKMLNFIFWIQPPVADVYLTKDFKIDIDIMDKQTIDHILQNTTEMKKISVN